MIVVPPISKVKSITENVLLSNDIKSRKFDFFVLNKAETSSTYLSYSLRNYCRSFFISVSNSPVTDE